MLSFTKPTSDQDGESAAKPENPVDGGTAAPEVRPLFTAAEATARPGPVDAADDAAVRGQIQRVRLDLLSRETERLEQQLRQVLEQQSEDRQLREELRAQIANLNRRIEKLLAGAKPAASGGSDGELKAAVKPLLQAVLQMLESTEPRASAGRTVPGAPPPASAAWSQVDAARRAENSTGKAVPAPDARAAKAALAQSPPAQAAAPPPGPAKLADDAALPRQAAADQGAAAAPTAEAAKHAQRRDDGGHVAASDPEDDLDPDPEAELRVEIARLLRPKKADGGFGPMPKPTARRASSDPRPTPPSSAPAAAPPEPLPLGTEQTPKLDAAVSAEPSREKAAAKASPEKPAPGANAAPPGKPAVAPEADTAQGDLRGGGAVAKNQRPSWAPRPNPLRASLPKCLTEPWEEPERISTGRWPFRRARPAGRRRSGDDGESGR